MILEGPAGESERDEGPDEEAGRLLREAPCWQDDRATRTEELAIERLDEADARTAERTRLEEEDKDIVRAADWGRGVEVRVVVRRSVVSLASSKAPSVVEEARARKRRQTTSFQPIDLSIASAPQRVRRRRLSLKARQREHTESRRKSWRKGGMASSRGRVQEKEKEKE